MESFRFITPALVKVSLVPLGDIAVPDFRRYCESISSVSDIRLLDVSPIPQCHYFNPQKFSQGRVFYSITTNFPSADSAFLDDFEPFRKTFIIIGVGSHPNSQNHAEALHDLRTRFPAAISHNVVYYQSPEHSDCDEVFHISTQAEKIATTVETMMCGVTKNFLQALDSYATSHENITLRSPISLTDSSVLTRTISRAQKRLSSGSAFKPSFANGQNVTPSTKDSKTKSSQRQNGRQAKLMGNFFLLAGRSQDALQYFTDAAINAKKADDHLWLASALEGLAVSALILSFLGLPYQVQNPMFTSVLQLPKSKGVSLMKANSKVSMDSIVSRQSVQGTPRNSTSSSLSLSANQGPHNTDMSQIPLVEFLLLLASRSSAYYKLSTADVDDCVPDIVYVESLLRNIKLMAAIHLSQTAEVSAIVDALVGSGPAAKQIGSAEFQLPKEIITAEIDQVFALQVSHFGITHQCRIFCALASVYHDLGLHRKQGLVLRFLLETLTSKASLIEQDPTSAFPSLSLKALIETIFGIYHIDTNTENSSSMASVHYSDWIILQLSFIKVCLRIAEAFRDYDTLMKLCILTLSRFVHCLPADDQVKLKEKLSWLRLITTNDSSVSKIPHPDPFMVRDAKFLAPSRSKSLVQLKAEQSSVSSKPTGAKPVFFDPYMASPKAINMDSIVCQNERYQLKVTLQNPFFFPLEIQAINIVADKESQIETLASSLRLISVSPLEQTRDMSNHGWKNATKKIPANDHQVNAGEDFTLPSNSSADVSIDFKPLVAGPIQIKGFDVVLEDSNSQFFFIVDREQFHGLEKLNHNLPTRSAEGSCPLDDLFQQLLSKFDGDRVTKKVVSLTAIHAQPKLTATNLQKINDWAMLLEGERRSSSTVLKNCSDVAINYLSISPWDSTIDSITSRLNSSALNAADIYELEWSLLEKKAIAITNKEEISSLYNVIQPGGELIIKYNVSGKKAMTESKLILEYGRKIPGFEDRTFVRKLVVPFNVSVHRSLGVISNDILPIFPTKWQSKYDSDENKVNGPYGRGLTKILDFVSGIQTGTKQKVSDYCILSLDVKNFWKDPLVAKIAVIGEDVDYIIEEAIFPNKTARLFVPIRRVAGKVLNPLRIIPSLRNKQFVKNYNLSEEEDVQTRRSFWVRDELLKCMKGTWLSNGASTRRCGEIDLRQIRLTTPMTNLLAYDDLSMYHSISSDEQPEQEVKIKDNKFILEREKFYTLRTRIVNHTERSISGILRYIPFPLNATNKQDLSLDSKILYNGVLQIHIGGDSIGPGMSTEKVLGFMILEKGSYEWGCIFDAAGEGEKRIVGREPAYIVAL